MTANYLLSGYRHYPSDWRNPVEFFPKFSFPSVGIFPDTLPQSLLRVSKSGKCRDAAKT